MWERIKDAIFGLKDTLGIETPEIPGLPADLASVGDAAGAVDTLSGVPAAAAEAVAPAVADLTETLHGISLPK
jgi:hypothetical protein